MYDNNSGRRDCFGIFWPWALMPLSQPKRYKWLHQNTGPHLFISPQSGLLKPCTWRMFGCNLGESVRHRWVCDSRKCHGNQLDMCESCKTDMVAFASQTNQDTCFRTQKASDVTHIRHMRGHLAFILSITNTNFVRSAKMFYDTVLYFCRAFKSYLNIWTCFYSRD